MRNDPHRALVPGDQEAKRLRLTAQHAPYDLGITGKVVGYRLHVTILEGDGGRHAAGKWKECWPFPPSPKKCRQDARTTITPAPTLLRCSLPSMPHRAIRSARANC